MFITQQASIPHRLKCSKSVLFKIGRTPYMHSPLSNTLSPALLNLLNQRDNITVCKSRTILGYRVYDVLY